MAPTILYAALVPFALAQTSVLTALYSGYETNSLVASLIGVDSSKTTLAVGCPKDDADCGSFPYQTLVLAPSAYSIDASDPNTDFTFTQDCVMSPQSAVCKESAGGSEANFPGSSTTTYDASDLGGLILTVTAGDVGKLAAQTTGSASASMATSTGTAQTGSKSESMASATKAQGTASASASASRSASGSASAAPTATGAATARVVALGSGLFAAAAGFIGGQIL